MHGNVPELKRLRADAYWDYHRHKRSMSDPMINGGKPPVVYRKWQRGIPLDDEGSWSENEGKWPFEWKARHHAPGMPDTRKRPQGEWYAHPRNCTYGRLNIWRQPALRNAERRPILAMTHKKQRGRYHCGWFEDDKHYLYNSE